MHTTKDLFGHDVIAESYYFTPSGKRIRLNGPKGGKNYVRPQGYAGKPGTGPKEKACKDCDHCVRLKSNKKTWNKCELLESSWTKGRATDILVNTPACKYFKPTEGTKE